MEVVEKSLGRLLHGGDYNPEQWLDHPDILDRDLAYLKKAKINEVTLGIFSWSVLEPEEGCYRFEWLENMIERLYRNQISVILATPSGARPKWLSDQYPEVLRKDENRNRNFFGGRHNHCYTSPVYREKVIKIDRELSRRWGAHPGVIAWHISNEFSGECHCELCQEAFRNWLEKKYGDIERLNKAWATTFWSHRYQDFSQIESPSPRGETMLHGLNLDWKRFVTDQTIDFLNCETAALKSQGSKLPVTTNLMYDFTGLNYYKFKGAIDVVSWDNYPTWHKHEEARTAMDTAMQHDLMRSLLKKPFLLMESCTGATNWQDVSKLKRPGMMKAASLQAIAHGSDSVQYFQIRQSRGASEKFHGSVIDHYGGDDTRVFKEVTEVGDALERLSEVAGSNTFARIALVSDQENRWAMEDAAGPRNAGLHYMETLLKSYSAFRKAGFDVDIVDMEQELDGYRIVAAPMLYMLRAGFEEKARQFVENGGVLIFTYWSGIVDDTDLCFLGGTPHGFMEMFGLRSMEIDALYDTDENYGVPVEGCSFMLSKQYQCRNLCDLVEVRTAEVLAEYADDFYAGYPALTRNLYGKGSAYYICADFEQGFYDELYAGILKQNGMKPLLEDLPEGVEVTSRENEEYTYLFVQNYCKEAMCVKLPVEDSEILYGSYNGRIGALDSVVLKRKKQV